MRALCQSTRYNEPSGANSMSTGRKLRSIIIVVGDHGPYLTGNCFRMRSPEFSPDQIGRAEIQDRFGSFVAIRWPDNGYEDYDDLTILQDLFPVIFAYLYRDIDLLSTRPSSELLPKDRLGIAGVNVVDGIISAGKNRGERLFETER